MICGYKIAATTKALNNQIFDLIFLYGNSLKMDSLAVSTNFSLGEFPQDPLEGWAKEGVH